MQVNEQGTIQDTWSTLVDPGSATGPSHVHGIIAHHVRNVPRFIDILPHIQQQLAGRTVVGHNATFDLEFLKTKFQRAGVIIPSWPLVCTMQIAKTYYPGESASLTDTSQRLNIETGKAHGNGRHRRSGCSTFLAHRQRLKSDGPSRPDNTGDR